MTPIGQAKTRWKHRLLLSLLGIAMAGCGTTSPPEAAQLPARSGTESRISGEIPVDGQLVFARSADLSFDVTGDVGELLVQLGDRVVEGQVLARLDSTTLTDVEAAVAQARFDLENAQDNLDKVSEEFATTPIAGAKFREDIEVAKQQLDDAERELEDFERDYVEDLARAQTAKADVGVRLDRAREDLEDFLSDYDQDLTDALQAKARADTQLDNAREALEDFQLDERRDVVGAWNIVANRFEVLVLAEDILTEFIRRPAGRGIGSGDEDDPGPRAIEGGEDDFGEGPYVLEEFRPTEGIADLRRLQAHVELAKVNLEKAYDDHLEELQRGEDPLLLAELEAKVETAESRQAQAIRDLERELEGADRLELQRRQAEVEEAEARLAQTERDLEEELEGPDKFELAIRKTEVLENQQELSEFTDGPDPLEVGVAEAQVALAIERLNEALEDFQGATVRAAFNGVISRVNVAVGDQANDKSIVLEMVDPTVVEVHGFVDASFIDSFAQGSSVEIEIRSLPGREFSGTVINVAPEPRKERGVVIYPLRIRVNLPIGLEVPLVPVEHVTTWIIP